MKSKLELDLGYISSFVDNDEMGGMAPFAKSAHNMLKNGTGLGSDYLGWLDLPRNYDREELARVKAAAEKIRKSCDAFIVVGIGGSYLGARAAIEMLSHNFYNDLKNDMRKGPRIFYAGNNMSSVYLKELWEIIKDMDVCVNVISKSGTTTEPAIAFRYIKELMENKYGKKEAAKRIYVTTDKAKGALKTEAEAEGYERFTIQDDIGGRYSVLTSVGLLPIAVAGINVDEILEGAFDACVDFEEADLWSNPAYQYAIARNILYKKGKVIEVLATFEPAMIHFGEWWKQLFAESEGKNGKGIFPTAFNYTADLHSLGQYVQEGRRTLFETFINVKNVEKDIIIKKNEDDLDGLNYLDGKTVSFIAKHAFEGSVLAHIYGGVPVMVLNIPKLSPYYFGYLVYFFEISCALSAYLAGVNPFNQPGVEMYKKNMFKLLGKPGYENYEIPRKDRSR
ncbi:MAG: glucose-6-phosphate isomerase [Clostridiaceae bacterium]